MFRTGGLTRLISHIGRSGAACLPGVRPAATHQSTGGGVRGFRDQIRRSEGKTALTTFPRSRQTLASALVRGIGLRTFSLGIWAAMAVV
jgi:hypothetical protein